MVRSDKEETDPKEPPIGGRGRALAEIFEKTPEAQGRYMSLGKAEVADHDDQRVCLKAGSATVEVTALGPGLFRVGMFPEGRTPDYTSEAIAKKDWEPLTTKMSNGKALARSTEAVAARISLDPLRISFADHSGCTFAADDKELGMGIIERPEADALAMSLGKPVRLYKRREKGERYFGCGERTSGLEKTGSHQIFYNVDPPLGHTAAF